VCYTIIVPREKLNYVKEIIGTMWIMIVGTILGLALAVVFDNFLN